MMTRRQFLRLAFGLGLLVPGYAFGVEPGLRLSICTHRLQPPQWPRGQHLRIAALADPHMGEPWMPLGRLERIVERVNGLGADLVVLLGDYEAGHPFVTRPVPMAEMVALLARLKAPLGVHGVLGNHDWWSDRAAQRRGSGPTETHRVFEAAGLPLMENQALRIESQSGAFWLLGLGDQLAISRSGLRGVDDLPGTLAQVTDDAPAILLAHEPDIFPRVPDRIALTLSGHTHGGQVRLFGHSPVVPSRYGNRFAYGHVREGRRDLVVSGGLGCSIIPVRFGVPPEITVIELS